MSKFQKEYNKNSNESGRTMMELLTILPIIGILSLAILIGFRQAMLQVAITEITDSISKSASSIITSQYLNSFSLDPDEPNPEYIVSDTIPLSSYMSEVTPPSQETINTYADLNYDLNLDLDADSFISGGNAIIAAHALEDGTGVFLAVYQIPTDICQNLLSSDLKYDYVTTLSKDVFNNGGTWYKQQTIRPINGQPNADKINTICEAVGEEPITHIGFVFDSDGCLMKGTQCNRGRTEECDQNQASIGGWCVHVE